MQVPQHSLDTKRWSYYVETQIMGYKKNVTQTLRFLNTICKTVLTHKSKEESEWQGSRHADSHMSNHPKRVSKFKGKKGKIEPAN